MSDTQELLTKLQSMEADYRGQPPYIQQADLVEINRLRLELTLPTVDSHLNEVIVQSVQSSVKTDPPMPVQTANNHAQAREIYQAYLDRLEVMEQYQVYAKLVVDATGGSSQTPVKPLATMGSNSEALLCDLCGKPMILEGGGFQGVYVDQAWKSNGGKVNWRSYISGGMTLQLQTNGTLRVYHGYTTSGCCRTATEADTKARAEFRASENGKLMETSDRLDLLFAFVRDELMVGFSEDDHWKMVNKIHKVMFGYDPGLGVNFLG